jgi:hypothetical protein
MMVNELFVPGTRIWNASLIHENFIWMDVEEIMKIQLGIHYSSLAFEKSGCNIVGSTYRKLKAD